MRPVATSEDTTDTIAVYSTAWDQNLLVLRRWWQRGEVEELRSYCFCVMNKLMAVLIRLVICFSVPF